MVDVEEKVETAGNETYHENHMGTVFKKGFSFSGYERDLLSISRGDGTFLDISGVSGVDSISDGRGSLAADFDNDGDLDLFLTAAQGNAHFLYRNNIGDENRFLRITLEGTSSGKDAWGTVVRLKGPHGIESKVKAGGAAFLSQNDPRLLFGLGDAGKVDWLEVTWPGGAVTRLENLAADRSIRIVEGKEGYEILEDRSFRLVDPIRPEEEFLGRLGFRKGDLFPNLALHPVEGGGTSLGAILHPGRKTLVNLWATWCVPCAKEMPELQALFPALEKAGVDLIGVSVDMDTAAAIPKTVAERKVTYPILVTDEAGMNALFPTGRATVPVSVLLDEQGRVLDLFPGWSSRTETVLRALARLD